MLSKIQALNFRGLKYISQELGQFTVLVGPNGSGKSSFMDIIGFTSDVLNYGVDKACNDRTDNFQDLLTDGSGDRFEFALEAKIPEEIRSKLGRRQMDTIRYEIAVGMIPDTNRFGILDERLRLYDSITVTPVENTPSQPNLFSDIIPIPITILGKKGVRGTQLVVSKVLNGNDNFSPEIYPEASKGFTPSFNLGPFRSALANLPADETKHPAALWFRKLLSEGVKTFILNSLDLRKSSSPSKGEMLASNGGNIPWVLDKLIHDYPDKYSRWIAHIQTVLPEINSVDVVERDEDRHKYIRVYYKSGAVIPSWMVSDGTLRLIALTLPAYIDNFTGIYLIEEPENGIHPKALEAIYQSLSSAYNAQIITATHSPIFLGMVEFNDILCFGKNNLGHTNIIKGSNHPKLKNWRHDVSLGTLFASGILG